MIIGIGTDIIETSRILALLEKHSGSFAKRILSEEELDKYDAQNIKAKFLAKKWAAKEAISKALGTGFTQGVSFADITIEHNEQGKPLVLLVGKTKKYADSIGIKKWSISISDEKHYALAFVIAES
jgi:holo-[acyl-carrier protein] synthase